MFGGLSGTAVRAFGIGLTLGGMLIAAAPGVVVGVAIAYVGIAIFLSALVWPPFEAGINALWMILTRQGRVAFQSRVLNPNSSDAVVTEPDRA